MNANWTPARIYNLYRIVIAVVLLASFYLSDRMIGQHLPWLFETTVTAYLILTLASSAADYAHTLRKPGWAQPLALVIDVLVLGLVVHSNGGLEGGLAVLLLVNVAAGNILLRGRLGFLIAALATLTAMFEQFYFATQTGDRDPFQLTEAGLLGIAFFMVSLIIQQIASRLERSEVIAARQRVAIQRLEALNQQIVARMRTGVMVFDDDHRVLQSNPSADGYFAQAMAGQHLPRALVERHQRWRGAPHLVPAPLRLSRQSPEVNARFADLDTGHEALTLVFLEDTARIAQEAQQLNLASLGRLSATLAHEIRNPLSAISQAAELLDEDGASAEDARLLTIIRNHVQRVNGIISDVLDLSRRPRGQAARFPVATALAELAAGWHQRGIAGDRLRVEHGDDTLEIRFDRSQFLQVVDNLIGNAFAHGGETCQVIVTYGQHPRTGLPWVAVRDDGPGVSEAAAAHLFEPFYTTSDRGNGLGLYVCRQLCEANQATLDHEPARPGARFVITCAHPDRQFQ
ncbi:sensor histidine kinase [Alloalcanivorax sp. C16-1]|uniref:sensor histidine kinase n=1 Tax=Alloalcanivorax sp. C16-1 TaxID=3390051 RepID=UPI003970BD57